MSSLIRIARLIGVTFAVLALLIGGMVVYFKLSDRTLKQRQEKLADLQSDVERFTGRFSESIAPTPYLKGKAVIVTRTTNSNTGGFASQRYQSTPYVDNMTLDLPDEIRAAKASEVQTVVWLNWGQTQVGTYTGASAARAMRESCTVTVIDLTTGAIIATQECQGGEPPKTVSQSTTGAVWGSGADSAVKEYLTHLQRRS